MERLKIAKDILKMAADLMLADSEYIYDPDHKKHPGGGYHKTEKGWSKLEEKKENGSHKKPVVDDSKSDEIPSLDDTRPMTEKEQWRYEQAFNGDWEMRMDYAEHESHPKILDKMSGDRNLSVVWEVAKNNHTHPSTLEKLSNSPESHIRKSVAENQNTHIKTLEKLSKDSDEGVSKAAKESISNRKKENKPEPKHESKPNTYKDIKPAGEAYNDAVFSTDQKELDALSNHSHFRVRETVAGNKNTSENTLRKLSSDEAFQVRAQVAGNPKTPKDILEKLSNDKEEYVSSNAKRNLAKREQSQSEIKFDITKLSPEMREKVKDWDAEDIAKFIGWLKEHKGK